MALVKAGFPAFDLPQTIESSGKLKNISAKNANGCDATEGVPAQTMAMGR